VGVSVRVLYVGPEEQEAALMDLKRHLFNVALGEDHLGRLTVAVPGIGDFTLVPSECPKCRTFIPINVELSWDAVFPCGVCGCRMRLKDLGQTYAVMEAVGKDWPMADPIMFTPVGDPAKLGRALEDFVERVAGALKIREPMDLADNSVRHAVIGGLTMGLGRAIAGWGQSPHVGTLMVFLFGMWVTMARRYPAEADAAMRHINKETSGLWLPTRGGNTGRPS
jgi:hypothetical protein